jgi:LytS/YehU family sensor histidine kinase
MKQRRFDEFTQIFLVNASQMAYLEEAPSTQVMLQKFYDLFRYFIKPESRVLLSCEMDILQSYIDIQKIRYGNRFNISFINCSGFGDTQINHLAIIDFILNDALIQYEKIISFTIEIVSSKDISLKVILETDSETEEFIRLLVDEEDIYV